MTTVLNHATRPPKERSSENDLGKLSLYVNGIGPTIDWLLDTGLKIDTKAGFTNEAEYSKPRCIRWVGGAPANMKLMFDLVKQSGTQVFTGTRVEKLLEEHGRVVGVEAEGTDGTKYTIRSRAVLLATGGFGYAKDLLTGNLKQSLYYGPVSSTGDGHKMAKAVGAKLQMMDLGKIYPNGVEVAPGIAKSTIWANKNAFEKGSGILIAKTGKRVISETASNNAIKNVELKQPKSMLYILMDQPTFELFKKDSTLAASLRERSTPGLRRTVRKAPCSSKPRQLKLPRKTRH